MSCLALPVIIHLEILTKYLVLNYLYAGFLYNFLVDILLYFFYRLSFTICFCFFTGPNQKAAPLYKGTDLPAYAFSLCICIHLFLGIDVVYRPDRFHS